MDHLAPALDSRRPARGFWPGGIALALSTAVHAAILPLAGWPWLSGPAAEDQALVIEVSLAWAPPAVQGLLEADTLPTAAPSLQRPPPAPRTRTTARLTPPATAAAPAAEAAAAGPIPPEAAPTTTRVTTTQVVTAPLPVVAAPAPPRPAGEAMAGYARLLLERLERHKTYPPLSARRGEEGTVTVRLTLAADGRLVAVEPAGEGPRRLVEASLAAVQAASPFPPLPDEMGTAQAVFSLPVTYRLN